MNVYIFKCSNGTYKIGKANDIAIRKVEVEKQYNITAETIAWKTIEDTLKFENMLHRKFQHYKANIGNTKEFFNVSKQQIDSLIQEHCFTLSSKAIKSELGIVPVIVNQNTRCPHDIERIQELEDKVKQLHDDVGWYFMQYQVYRMKKELFSVHDSRRNFFLDLIITREDLLDFLNVPKSAERIEEDIQSYMTAKPVQEIKVDLVSQNN